MKIQFDPDLEHQADAINAVVGVFEGQEICQTNFTVAGAAQGDLFAPNVTSDIGIGNRLVLLDDELEKNAQAMQLANGLKQTSFSNQGSGSAKNFTIEMETGTGKTYVYLRSAFELHKKYGFTKFIIVVPSVAVKEGVYKSLQMTEEHFRSQYDNVQYDYFVYDSSKREQVRNFATSDYIQIMVINIDAFRKSFTDPSKETTANLIHRADDRLSGMKPIEFIQSTNPIVIIDEPQSVDSTEKSKEAIQTLNPLCTLRYSATHVDKHNMLYKLDSIDAYDRKLVKQIEVASIDIKDSHNKAYIKLLKVSASPRWAEVEFDEMKSGAVNRVKKKLKCGDDLFEKSGGRDVYHGYIINDIYTEVSSEYIDFTSRDDIIELGQAIGSVDENEFKRLQIRKTIEEHLDKELKLIPKGIKVLSLFFLDKVGNYRAYDGDGNPTLGKFGKIFEEELYATLKKPKFKRLYPELYPEGKLDDFALKQLVSEVHNGYFAIDKKKDAKGNSIFKESAMSKKGESAKSASDEGAYNLIMKDKERLLDINVKLRFIFSHSALKEGWDNPNVFQICTLNETNSVMKKRQEIGRGLRICVNQEGERVHGFDVNTLTVMANESYEKFVSELQHEIEKEEGIKFGLVEKHQFANIPVFSSSGEKSTYLGAEKSEQLWTHLNDQGYLDIRGKVTDELKTALKENTVSLPEGFAEQTAQINALLKKVAGGLNIKKQEDKKPVQFKKQAFDVDFKPLWDRIKYKTYYRVDFDPEALVIACAKEIQSDLVVGMAKFKYTKATTAIEQSGVNVVNEETSNHSYTARDYQLPDIVTYLQEQTNLTRKSIVNILRKCGRLEAFKMNPQKFIEQAVTIIKNQMRLFIVDGIKYEKIGDDEFYAQELFEDQELMGYLSKNMLPATKSIYDHVIYDSDVEETFAQELENNTQVKVYAKLPSWFKIDTPLGSYNPDWAVLVDKDGAEKLYFVVETKGSMFSDALRPTEKAKIDCGKAHFAALGNDTQFIKADSYDSFDSQVA
jgi:type III restriction enzyme